MFFHIRHWLIKVELRDNLSEGGTWWQISFFLLNQLQDKTRFRYEAEYDEEEEVLLVMGHYCKRLLYNVE